jgi:hypothetical protein
MGLLCPLDAADDSLQITRANAKLGHGLRRAIVLVGYASKLEG